MPVTYLHVLISGFPMCLIICIKCKHITLLFKLFEEYLKYNNYINVITFENKLC